MELQPISVGLVGLGMSGRNHYYCALSLEQEGIIDIVAAYDTKDLQDTTLWQKADVGQRRRLSDLSVNSLDSLCQKVGDFGAVQVVANTASHYGIATSVFAYGIRNILMEKPTTFTLGELTALGTHVANLGVNLQTSYLLRSSKALQQAIVLMREEGSGIVDIKINYHKDRTLDLRPSAGVIRDEVTHPLDLALYVLFELGQETKYPHRIDFDHVVVRRDIHPYADLEAQRILYDRLVKMAGTQRVEEEYGTWQQFQNIDCELEFSGNIGSVTIDCFSSFVKGPMQREIIFTCDNQKKYLVRFDRSLNGSKGDTLEIFEGSLLLSPEKLYLGNRLEDQLRAFYQTMQQSLDYSGELGSMAQMQSLEGIKSFLLRY